MGVKAEKDKRGPSNRGHSGYRDDLGLFFRSSLEANYARILKYHKIPFEYEAKTFQLSDGTTYTPDFYLPRSNEYIELKGNLEKKEQVKYTQFKKDYPDVKWSIVTEKSKTWKTLKYQHKYSIPEWES